MRNKCKFKKNKYIACDLLDKDYLFKAQISVEDCTQYPFVFVWAGREY